MACFRRVGKCTLERGSARRRRHDRRGRDGSPVRAETRHGCRIRHAHVAGQQAPTLRQLTFEGRVKRVLLIQRSPRLVLVQDRRRVVALGRSLRRKKTSAPIAEGEEQRGDGDGRGHHEPRCSAPTRTLHGICRDRRFDRRRAWGRDARSAGWHL